MTLKPITATCVPRADVLSGGLSDNHFAAQLDKVVRNPNDYPVYGDADQFFAITYPTSGLRNLLTRAFGRVTKASGVAGENGVLRSETSFGGGKTHGLTAVYHLAKGARPADLDRFIDKQLLPPVPVQIAAIVGDALDPVAGLSTNGVRTYTIWGEMAAQIGPDAVAVMTKNDEERSAPGTRTILESFGGEPTIVIIDEIAQHLRQAIESGDEGTRRYSKSVPVFLKNLFEVAGDPANRVSVIVTLASAKNAFGKETNEITALLDEVGEATQAALTETNDVVIRMVKPSAVIKPAEDAEIGEILKARLFEHIDPKAAAQAASEYQTLYADLADEGESLSGGAEQPASYAKTVETSYPFHPELVRVLDNRLGAIPSFQRARGSLKLLAEVVAGIYSTGDPCDIINVADIDFANEPVLNHLTIGLGRPEFAQVASVDLAGPASHSAAVDRAFFSGKPPYATRTARTVFVHSLEQTVTSGAGRSDWVLGTLRPGESVSFLETALAESERVCWHLSSDATRWRFHTEPNVTAILEEEKANVQNTRVAQVLDDRVQKTFSNDAGITSAIYPAGPAGVPDESELRVVVIDPDQRTVNGKDAGKADALLVEILDHKGQDKTPRIFRNSIVFVVADSDQQSKLEDKVRAAIAADAISGDAQRMTQFSDDVRKKIKTFQDAAQLELRIAVTRCFKHVYYPTSDKARGHLHHVELPPQQQGDTRSGTGVVATLLTDESKIKDTSVSYDWLQEKAWPKNKNVVTTEEIRQWFWRDHTAPVFRTVDPLRKAIGDGIRNGGWVYHDSSTGKVYTATSMAGLNIEFRDDAELMLHKTAEDSGLLVRKPTTNDLKGSVVGTKVLTGTEIREILEAKCGGEPSKADVAEVLASAANGYEWIVVLDAEPADGVRALTPTEIKEKGLEGLRILVREHAESMGVTFPGRTVVKTKFTAAGVSGVALADVLNRVSDSGRPLSVLRIQAAADEVVGIDDISLLTSSLGMAQQFEVDVQASLTAEFAGVTGQIDFDGAADRTTFQGLNAHLAKIWQAAERVAGHVTLSFRFEPPIEPSSAPVSQLVTIYKSLNVTNATVTAEVTK